MAKRVSNIKRKFYFYNIEAKYADLSSNIVRLYKNPENALIKTFEGFQRLKYSNNRYTKEYLFHQNRDGNYVYVITDEINEDYIKFQLLLCRDKLLPFIEEGGKLTPLTVLLSGGNKKLAEISHGVIFLKSNILALEYNFAGAKRNDLAEYIDNKTVSTLMANTYFSNLLNIDALKKIKENNEMSLFRIRVLSNSSVISMLTKADSSFEALKCKKENIDYVELILRRRITKNKRGFKMPAINRELIAKMFKAHKDDFDALKVKYGSGTDEIDLLSDQFVCSDSFIPVEKTRTILASEAYSAMINYYEENVKVYVTEK